MQTSGYVSVHGKLGHIMANGWETTPIVANDSEFTDGEWLTIEALATGWRNDGYDGTQALKYAIMDFKRQNR